MKRKEKKLTARQAKRIRELYATKEYIMAGLARRYGVSTMTVSRVVRGEGYKDAGGPVSKNNWHNSGNVKNFWWYDAEGRETQEKAPAPEVPVTEEAPGA